jgi:dipeptidyl aminopeptidase/acylaminoacyl peptidase
MTVPLIPRQVLFGNPDKANVQISPDGSQISFLAPLDGVLNVWVAPREDPGAARPVTRDSGRGVRINYWAHTSRHILFLQDLNGDENWRVFSVDLQSAETKDLTPFEGVAAQPYPPSHKHPDEILVGINNREAQWHDLYRINITSGERVLIEQNDRFMGFIVTDDNRVFGAAAMTPNGGMALYWKNRSSWQPFDLIPPDDVMTTAPEGFNQDNTILYMRDSRDRDTSALVEVDLRTSQRRLLAEDSRADLADVIRHPTEKTIQAVSYIYERKAWQYFDQAVEADMGFLHSVARGEVEVTSRSNDDRYWVVAFHGDDQPANYYLFDRSTRQAIFLFSNRKDLEEYTLTKMIPLVIKARDGLDLVGYYSLPPGSDSNDDNIPDQPLPMVFYPHGGPWGRDFWGLNPWHQWLANRGYAVLCINFRASTGFGKAFINAGNLKWGTAIVQDQVDAVEWAIQAGIADPAKIAIMGGSFGGYSTLAGLTLFPDLYSCGVDLFGPSNLITLLTTIPPYWKPQIELFATRVGDLRTEEGRELLIRHSPLTHVGKIKKPLLIGQGANDARVKQDESDQIVRAMKARSIPVTYLLYPDEGHGFARPENNLSFNAVAEAFLAQNLGGLFEPFGEDLKGSSIKVLDGAEAIPGLSELIPKE